MRKTDVIGNLTQNVRKTGWIVCVLMVLLCSCSSSKNTYKKRNKPAPCNCPKFNYVPQNDKGTYANICILCVSGESRKIRGKSTGDEML